MPRLQLPLSERKRNRSSSSNIPKQNEGNVRKTKKDPYNSMTETAFNTATSSSLQDPFTTSSTQYFSPPTHKNVHGTDPIISSLSLLHSSLMCSLCNHLLQSPATLASCTHSFCHDCIFQHISSTKNETCPTCGVATFCVGKKLLQINPQLDSVVNGYKQMRQSLKQLPSNWWQRREEEEEDMISLLGTTKTNNGHNFYPSDEESNRPKIDEQGVDDYMSQSTSELLSLVPFHNINKQPVIQELPVNQTSTDNLDDTDHPKENMDTAFTTNLNLDDDSSQCTYNTAGENMVRFQSPKNNIKETKSTNFIKASDTGVTTQSTYDTAAESMARFQSQSNTTTFAHLNTDNGDDSSQSTYDTINSGRFASSNQKTETIVEVTVNPKTIKDDESTNDALGQSSGLFIRDQEGITKEVSSAVNQNTDNNDMSQSTFDTAAESLITTTTTWNSIVEQKSLSFEENESEPIFQKRIVRRGTSYGRSLNHSARQHSISVTIIADGRNYKATKDHITPNTKKCVAVENAYTSPTATDTSHTTYSRGQATLPELSIVHDRDETDLITTPDVPPIPSKGGRQTSVQTKKTDNFATSNYKEDSTTLDTLPLLYISTDDNYLIPNDIPPILSSNGVKEQLAEFIENTDVAFLGCNENLLHEAQDPPKEFSSKSTIPVATSEVNASEQEQLQYLCYGLTKDEIRSMKTCARRGMLSISQTYYADCSADCDLTPEDILSSRLLLQENSDDEDLPNDADKTRPISMKIDIAKPFARLIFAVKPSPILTICGFSEISTCDGDLVRRTFGYILSVAAGLPMATSSWITACAAKREWIPFSNSAADPNTNENCEERPRRQISSNRRKNDFDNKSFQILGCTKSSNGWMAPIKSVKAREHRNSQGHYGCGLLDGYTFLLCGEFDSITAYHAIPGKKQCKRKKTAVEPNIDPPIWNCYTKERVVALLELCGAKVFDLVSEAARCLSMSETGKKPLLPWFHQLCNQQQTAIMIRRGATAQDVETTEKYLGWLYDGNTSTMPPIVKVDWLIDCIADFEVKTFK